MPEDAAGQAYDELESPALGTAPAPAQPATPDIESIRADIAASIKQELEASFNERVAGFQRLIAERDAELRELKTAGLSEEEREQLARRESEEELEALRRENELLRLSSEFPDEMPIFRQILNAPTAKDQLALLKQIRAAQAASQAPAPPPPADPDIPDVLPTNPMRPFEEGVILPDGTVMTDALADSLLKSAGRGALFAGR